MKFHFSCRDLSVVRFLLIQFKKGLLLLYVSGNLGSPKKDAKGGVLEESLKVSLCLIQSWRNWATIIFNLESLLYDVMLDHNIPCRYSGLIEVISNFFHGVSCVGVNHWESWVSLAAR